MPETRSVLIIDGNAETAQAAQGALEPYGLRVVAVADGSEGIAQAKDDPPALVLLSLEPNNVGYATCNKIKKAPYLKDVPVILQSTTADPAAFEQHKKLKARADEYLLIGDPAAYPVDEMLSKVHALIGLASDEGAAEGDGAVELDLGDAIEADDVGAEAEVTSVPDGSADPDFANGEATRVAPPSVLEAHPDADDEGSFDDIFHDDGASAAEPDPNEVFEGPPTNAAPEAAVLEGLEEVAKRSADTKAASGRSGDAELAKLREERDRLAKEVEDLKKSGGGTSFSREREFLNLREVISKKEKEILDLKDEIDSKERQTLEQRNKARELERRAREQEDKLLAMERDLVGANERIEALTHDKEKVVEREAQTKVRLAETQAALRKTESELDTAQKRAKADGESSQREMARLQREQAEAIEALKAQHAEQITELNDQHAGESARLREQHAGQLAQQRQEHEENVAALRAQHQSALEAAEARRQADAEKAAENAAAALAEAQQQAEARRQADLQVAEEARRDQLAGQKARHDQAVAEMQQQHHAEMEQAAQERQASETALQGQIDQLSAALQQAQSDLAAARARIQELERESAAFQDQILRAYQKIKGDQALSDKVRRALGVALALLDEQARTGQELGQQTEGGVENQA